MSRCHVGAGGVALQWRFKSPRPQANPLRRLQNIARWTIVALALYKFPREHAACRDRCFLTRSLEHSNTKGKIKRESKKVAKLNAHESFRASLLTRRDRGMSRN